MEGLRFAKLDVLFHINFIVTEMFKELLFYSN